MSDETPLSIRHPAEVTIGGVIVVQEAFGVTDHSEDVCQRFADAGWLAVAPHLFHRTGDPVLDHTDFDAVRPHAAALTAEGVATDVDAALDYVEGAGRGALRRTPAPRHPAPRSDSRRESRRRRGR